MLTYTPSLDNVGTYLSLYWLLTQVDGKCGKRLVAISSSPVISALPMISGVRVKELSFGTYSEQGKYFGGYVGASLFSWYLEKIDGTIVLIKGATSLTYKVNEADCYCHLLFEFTPVRSDSLVGDLLLYTNRHYSPRAS